MADQAGSSQQATDKKDQIESTEPALNEAEVLADSNSSADGGEPNGESVRSTQPRFQLRAAINSAYQPVRPITAPFAVPPQTPPPPPPDPAELQRAAEIQNMLAKGQTLARQGQLDQARRTFGEVIQRDPENSEAWTWLGGLLIESSPERAHQCLQRAVELDPTSDRARRGLAQAQDRLDALAQQTQAATEPEPTDGANPVVEEDPTRPDIKIGLEEAVASLRQSGVATDPEAIPMGGARIRPAVEKGELKLPRRRRRRRPPMSDFRRSMLVLGFLVFVCLIGLGLAIIVPILNQPPDPANFTPTPLPPTDTPVPPTNDEVFAARLRTEIDHYNRFFGTARTLRQQVQSGKLVWDDYRRGVRDLQTGIRNEKKTLDDLALGTTAKLTPYYRNLQSVATLSGQAIDFTVSGVENTNPEDLEEGNRQFLEASRLLAVLNQNLNQASPIPTPVPTATPRPTITPTVAPDQTGTPDTNTTPGPTVFGSPASTNTDASTTSGTTVGPTTNAQTTEATAPGVTTTAPTTSPATTTGPTTPAPTTPATP